MIKLPRMSNKTRDLLLCLLSVICLVLSFPQTSWSFLAFVALIPLFFALERKTFKQAFHLSYKAGWLFFICALYWIMLVPPEILTIFGLLALVAYLALFFALFGLFYRWTESRSALFKLFVLPSVWTLLEYVRGHLFTGFGWASLCHSQTKNLVLIQIADVTGMLGVSFFIVFVNVFFKEIISERLNGRKGVSPQKVFSLGTFISCGVLMTTCVLGYGIFCLKTYPIQFAQGAKVAIVQGNIRQDDKLNQSRWDRNYLQYKALTQNVAEQNPDLIIWPETALPGYINIDDSFLIRVRELVKTIKIPVLLGTVENDEEDYYNIALLLTGNGEIVQKYRKMHLVPFGEYIPFRKTFPILSSIIPIGDFSASDEYTVFNRESEWLRDVGSFSVQICFEDAVPQIARRFVNRSADFLVNITNDAWFKDTKAPYLHLQSSVFRSVENRRTLIRAANTGVSCFINPLGEAYQSVEEKVARLGGKKTRTFIEGFAIGTVYVSKQHTFYSQWGDIFILFCAGIAALGGIKMLREKKS